MISSTEIRKRILEARQEEENDAINNEEQKLTEEEIKSKSAIKSASYFFQIGGLVTKSTIEFIRDNNLY